MCMFAHSFLRLATAEHSKCVQPGISHHVLRPCSRRRATPALALNFWGDLCWCQHDATASRRQVKQKSKQQATCADHQWSILHGPDSSQKSLISHDLWPQRLRFSKNYILIDWFYLWIIRCRNKNPQDSMLKWKHLFPTWSHSLALISFKLQATARISGKAGLQPSEIKAAL